MAAKWKRLKCKRIVVMAVVVVLGWILVGGIDCAPPDDADLIVPLRDKTFVIDGNGWVKLASVLDPAEYEALGLEDASSEDESDEKQTVLYDLDALSLYVDPENYPDHYSDDPDLFASLAFFTNAVTGRMYIETLLKSDEVRLARIDAAITSLTYAPPLVPPQSLVGDRPGFSQARLFDGLSLELLARVKCAVDKSDFDAAVEYFGRNLRLATFLQTRCNGYRDYYLGMHLCDANVFLLGQLLDDFEIPADKLRQFDELLKDLPGFSSEAAAHVLKLEYTYDREVCMKRRVDLVFPSWLPEHDKWLAYPLARYVFHPNRVLRTKAKYIRDALRGEAVELGKRDRRERRWLDVLVPNSLGRFAVSGECESNNYGRCLNEDKESVLERIADVRLKIEERINAQQTNGEFVAGSRYFPLVFTNGCYYTHDLKRMIGEHYDGERRASAQANSPR